MDLLWPQEKKGTAFLLDPFWSPHAHPAGDPEIQAGAVWK